MASACSGVIGACQRLSVNNISVVSNTDKDLFADWFRIKVQVARVGLVISSEFAPIYRVARKKWNIHATRFTRTYMYLVSRKRSALTIAVKDCRV